MPLDLETRKMLVRDYQHVSQEIEKVLADPDVNFLIIDADYIHPTTESRPLPLQDYLGKFHYFRHIRTCLETAIVEESITPALLPNKAPDYLCELVNK